MKKSIIESSIIISVYNEDKFIDNCLKSLIHEIINNQIIELIIIDNSSKDNTNYLCRKFLDKYKKTINCKLIKIKHDKLTVSRNTGIKHAEGKYLHFIDGDTIVEEGFHKNIIKSFKDTNCDIIGGNVKLLNHKSTIGSFIWNSYMSQQFTKDKALIGANMAFKKELFDKIGFFDLCENSRGDETLLLKKYETKIKNKKQIFCKESNLKHFCIDDLKKWFLVTFQEGITGINIQRKYKQSFLKKCFMIYRVIHILLPLHLTLFLILNEWNKMFFLIHLLIFLIKPLIQIDFFINGIKNCIKNRNFIQIFFVIPFIFITRYTHELGYIYGFFKYKSNNLRKNEFRIGKVLEIIEIKNDI